MQPEYLDRLFNPRMEFYREVYKNSPRWDGIDSIKDKDVIVYCEQGFGDILQMVRYIPYLKHRGCRIHLHCPLELHSLFQKYLKGVDSVFDKDEQNLPKHDYHTLSMSLPFVLGLIDVEVPYINITETLTLASDKFKIGIAWEGNKNHTNNDVRSCPLGVFRRIHDMTDVDLYMVQKQINDPRFIKDCEDFNLLGTEINSFEDTARLINSMDLIISVDTSVLHLAGAMGKRAFALFGKIKDPRWNSGVNWYPTIKFIDGDWSSISGQLVMFVNMEKSKWQITRPAKS